MKVTKSSIKANEAKFEGLRQSCHDAVIDLIQSNAHWPKNDARRWLFSRLATVLFMSTLNLYIESEYLNDLGFWKKYLGAGDPNQTAKDGFRYFDRHARASLVLESVAALEHSYNIILNAANLGPKKSNFYNLFSEVVKLTHSKDRQENGKKSFKLLRLIRNCHHNSWIHKPDNDHESRVTITYKGSNYCFQEDHMPTFISWELLHDVLEDILHTNTTLIKHHRILRIKQINDPGAMELMRE